MEDKLKLVSWNVNGLRACLKKGFMEFFKDVNADIVCLQEIKMEQGQAELDLNSYHDDIYREYWNSAEKKGYSGAAVFTKIPPLSATYGMGIAEHDREGRIITLKFSGFYLVNVYTPNSQHELKRLDYRMRWEDDFREYVRGLDAVKPVIICGDLNVAHTEKDIKNAKPNERNAGYTKEERDKMTKLLDAGFTDFYRYLNPEKRDAYTWWSYMGNSREKNVGWRIDYFLGSNRLVEKVGDSCYYLKDAFILPDVYGSDHCPVGLMLQK